MSNYWISILMKFSFKTGKLCIKFITENTENIFYFFNLVNTKKGCFTKFMKIISLQGDMIPALMN